MSSAKELNLLFVDDEPDTHLIYEVTFKKVFKGIGVMATITCIESADLALDILNNNDVYSGIVVDGLFGECWKVTAVANERDIPIIVYSGSGEIVKLAEQKGITTALKGESSEEFNNLVQDTFYRNRTLYN